MIASRVQSELNDLVPEFPGIFTEMAPDGTAEIVVPAYPLPSGWNVPACEVLVVAPLLYPDQQPDNFWTQPGLLTPSGQQPTNCMGQISRRLKTWNQYSWHWGSTRWDRDCHNLATFMRSIRNFFARQT